MAAQVGTAEVGAGREVLLLHVVVHKVAAGQIERGRQAPQTYTNMTIGSLRFCSSSLKPFPSSLATRWCCGYPSDRVWKRISTLGDIDPCSPKKPWVVVRLKPGEHIAPSSLGQNQNKPRSLPADGEGAWIIRRNRPLSMMGGREGDRSLPPYSAKRTLCSGRRWGRGSSPWHRVARSCGGRRACPQMA